MTLWEDLEYRGLIKDISNKELKDKLNNGKITFYIGTDPTADSMHLGHFSSFLIATRLAKYGHHPILLIGGATGLIGDPKPSLERPMITKEEVKKNVEGLTKQAKEIFGFEVVNNYDWIQEINTIDFLRDYGKYININYMLDKDIIKRRMDSGITFCEFSYMMLQALDFVHLYENKNVTLQVAGSDQWGNITTGIELARKKCDAELFGLTMPLVLDSNGVKFGKTEGNALWLDEKKTSSYELYQYLINADDNIVIDYLKRLTFLNKEEIEKIEEEFNKNRQERLAQKVLAKEVITFLHGENSYNEAVKISEALFKNDINSLTVRQIELAFKNIKSYVLDSSKTILEVLSENNIINSRREIRELLKNNAISINGEIVNDENYILTNETKYYVIRKGKKNYYLIKTK